MHDPTDVSSKRKGRIYGTLRRLTGRKSLGDRPTATDANSWTLTKADEVGLPLPLRTLTCAGQNAHTSPSLSFKQLRKHSSDIDMLRQRSVAQAHLVEMSSSLHHPASTKTYDSLTLASTSSSTGSSQGMEDMLYDFTRPRGTADVLGGYRTHSIAPFIANDTHNGTSAAVAACCYHTTKCMYACSVPGCNQVFARFFQLKTHTTQVHQLTGVVSLLRTNLGEDYRTERSDALAKVELSAVAEVIIKTNA